MSLENVMSSKLVRDLKTAQWEGFRRLAAKMPNHHVLAIELVRTFDNETAAVFTVVQKGVPVRSVVFGDERGRVQQPKDCHHKYEALARMAASPEPTEGDQSPDFALGQPPVHQPPTPGLVSLGSALLASAFDVGEHIDTSR